eukprot:CAMPEP_0113845860 /NCGR_PEP_ID=MMETSP0372-20130328/988_1 /TAXON_ID=340204 /ORGANISM="Lankesteria abbotti" /LENGTH=271 /DNA_ID=CAMNT_0000814943 /DNA_START=105 /DNA_END=920 /DNA_ORIENTATION=+ /assembly_acc=CAM_ASM_000359
MATLSTAVFDSDEDDDDYVDSDVDASGDDEDDNTHVKTRQLPTIESKRASRLLVEMYLESNEDATHHPTVSKTDFMLQFQKIHPRKEKATHTPDSILKLVNGARGECLKSSSEKFDIQQFKKISRSQETSSRSETDTSFEDGLLSADVLVNQVVRYAGQTVTIQKKVPKSSTMHKNHLNKMAADNNTQRRDVQSVQSLLNDFGKTRNITTVEKSLSDWQEFKDTTGLEDTLRQNRKDGFLGRQAFLAVAEERMHQQLSDGKRRRIASDSKT